MPAETTKMLIVVPADWKAAFKRASAAAKSKSLSEWVGERCAEALPAKTKAALSARPRVGRPAKSAAE